MVAKQFTKNGQEALDKNPLDSDGLYPDPEKLLSEDTIDLNILKRLVGQCLSF